MFLNKSKLINSPLKFCFVRIDTGHCGHCKLQKFDGSKEANTGIISYFVLILKIEKKYDMLIFNKFIIFFMEKFLNIK